MFELDFASGPNEPKNIVGERWSLLNLNVNVCSIGKIEFCFSFAKTLWAIFQEPDLPSKLVSSKKKSTSWEGCSEKGYEHFAIPLFISDKVWSKHGRK